MRNTLVKSVQFSQLAKALNLNFQGLDVEILRVDPISHLQKGSLSFLVKERIMTFPPDVAVLAYDGFKNKSVSHLSSHHPRLDFVRALQWLEDHGHFLKYNESPKIHPSVKVGEFAYIAKNVEIGEGTVVMPHAVIHEDVKIGKRCVIKSGAVIGHEGFGFERDEQGIPQRFIHVGGVVIGNDVQIGSMTTVCRAALHETVIEDYVKIDDHVHVGHNVYLGAKSIITACTEFSGGVVVGEEVWISPHVSIKEQVKIGNGAYVGLGAVVLKDVAAGEVVVGNPARPLEKKGK